MKKSHTCEESGNHLRISVWNLLINKKHNYLLKKLLKWANKKCKNFNIYTVYFFKKNKEKHLDLDKLFFYICAPKNLDMIYSSWYIECDRLKLVIVTPCYCHVTHAFQSESTLYSCLNVKEPLAWSRRKIWSLSDCNWTETEPRTT